MRSSAPGNFFWMQLLFLSSLHSSVLLLLLPPQQKNLKSVDTKCGI